MSQSIHLNSALNKWYTNTMTLTVFIFGTYKHKIQIQYWNCTMILHTSQNNSKTPPYLRGFLGLEITSARSRRVDLRWGNSLSYPISLTLCTTTSNKSKEHIKKTSSISPTEKNQQNKHRNTEVWRRLHFVQGAMLNLTP